MNFVDLINDKEAFTAAVKHSLNDKAFTELDSIKRELATSFIANVEGDNNADTE